MTNHYTFLQINQLSHSFKKRHSKSALPVLEQLSLHVEKGEFVSLIGPSGCGKSTLFQLIGGLIEPNQGNIVLRGKTINGCKGHVSFVPQQPALFPWRTILDNVLLASEIAGKSRRMFKAEALTWLERVGLKGYEQSYPYQLSGGMQQRVAFVRAMLSPQELICLDEPFSALDAITRMEMQQWLLDIWEECRRTVLFVTHSIEEALYLSDRIYVLSQRPGRIIEELSVPFPRPRQERMLTDPSFAQIKSRIYQLLKGSSV